MSADLRLIAIVDPAVLGGRDLDWCARAAEEGGATAIQIRMKGAAGSDVFRATSRLVAALRIPVYVNDRADVAWAARADGVHVGSDDIPPRAVRDLSPAGFQIGVSVGSEVEAAAASGAPVDYWSIGPIYRTGTKPDAGEPIGTDGFTALARLAPERMPQIAIGGIRPETVPGIIAAGAHGVAVSDAVFGTDDIAVAARRVRETVDRSLAARNG